MRKNSLVLIVLLLVAPWQIWAQGCSNIPKIPSNLGKGYDIVFGNPSSNNVDPGFKFDVVAFDFKDGATTDDKKFLVPDGIVFQKSPPSTYNSAVGEFRGTQSYQNDLKLNAIIGGDYDGDATKQAFRASIAFKNMQQKISK